MDSSALSPELLIALTAFALVSSITPGPNVLMLVASSANFGIRRTLPHAIGIPLGFCGMIIVLGLGLGEILKAVPWVLETLRIVCALYIAYLAWNIARAGSMSETGARGRPLRWHEAAAFQWVNPKAVAMALGSLAIYAPGGTMLEVFVVAAVFALVCVPAEATWLFAGSKLKHFLTNPLRLRVFNVTMALLLVGSVGWALAFAYS